jgi:hypothetical protein
VVSTLYSKAASFGVLLVTSCKQEGCRRISFSGPTHGRPKNRRLPTVILSPCHSWCWRSKGPQEIGMRSGSSCQELQPLYTGVQNRVNCARTGIGRLERLLGGRPHQLDQRSPHNYFNMSVCLKSWVLKPGVRKVLLRKHLIDGKEARDIQPRVFFGFYPEIHDPWHDKAGATPTHVACGGTRRYRCPPVIVTLEVPQLIVKICVRRQHGLQLFFWKLVLDVRRSSA